MWLKTLLRQNIFPSHRLISTPIFKPPQASKKIFPLHLTLTQKVSYFPLITEVVEVGSAIDEGREKERGSDAGGMRGEEWRGLPSLGMGEGGM